MLTKEISKFKKFLVEAKRKGFCYIWNKIRDIEDPERKTRKVVNKYDYVDLKFGSNARRMLSHGIIEMADTVAKTFGPLGKNVAISERKEPIIVTKDGVTVAKYIHFSSRRKNLGCRILSAISGSTNEHAGDGTTTSTILGAEIVKKGTLLMDIGFNPMEVKKGLEFASKKFLEYLEEKRATVKDKKDIYNLAMVTTNNNEEISDIVSKALEVSGNKAVINIEESQTGLTELKIEEGMFLNNGFASIEYVSAETEDSIMLENPLVLVVRKPIKEIAEIMKVLEYMKNLERPLVLFSPEIKKEPLSVLLYNRRKNNLDCIAVNIPDYLNDEANLEILRDICSMTGAKLCDLDDIQDAEFEKSLLFEDNFGATSKCRVSEFQTVLMGVKGDKQEIQNILYALEYKVKTEKNPGYKSYYQDRLSRLHGRSVSIQIGGITNVEIMENRDKIVDALNSCQTAIEAGILPGGGSSFAHGLKILEKIKLDNENLNVGVNLFYHAIINTLKHLYKNTDILADTIIEKIKSNDNITYGYNLNKKEFSDDLVQQGIIDSFNTIKTAIEDAVSVAGMLITTECIVFREYDYEPPPLDAFRNRIKSDPEYRDKVRKQFNDPQTSDDFKTFSSVI